MFKTIKNSLTGTCVTNKQTNTHENIPKILRLDIFVYQSTYCTNATSSQY